MLKWIFFFEKGTLDGNIYCLFLIDISLNKNRQSWVRYKQPSTKFTYHIQKIIGWSTQQIRVFMEVKKYLYMLSNNEITLLF